MKKLIRKSIAMLVLCVMALNLCTCALAETPSEGIEAVCANVIEIEKYGHAVLDITTADFTGIGYELGDVVCVRFDSYESEMPFMMGIIRIPVRLCSADWPRKRISQYALTMATFPLKQGSNWGTPSRLRWRRLS